MDGASRRGLLRGAAAVGVAALASGCRLEPLERPGGALRPPGARVGRAFLDLCIRCGRCALACAAGCIRFDDSLGPEGSTPFIVPTERACILCMRCGGACPTGAIEPIPADINEVIERVRMGTAVLDRQRCWARGNRGVCRACWYACPLPDSAIELRGPGLAPHIEEDHCVGCGICAQVCPPAAAAITIRPREA